jgi:hypothetical protein
MKAQAVPSRRREVERAGTASKNPRKNTIDAGRTYEVLTTCAEK